MMRVVLASGSPRRRELLKKIYKDFEVLTSDVDESIDLCKPDEIVEELAKRKAEAVFNSLVQKDEAECNDILVIGSDTIVYYDGDVLGKPEDEEDARAMISMLSDRTHQVYTGVALVYIKQNSNPLTVTFNDVTDVTFYDIDKFDIADYIKSGSPMDKAGAYGIQDDFAKHVKKIDGDYNNVVGLPVAKLYQKLKECKLV